MSYTVQFLSGWFSGLIILLGAFYMLSQGTNQNKRLN